MTVPLTCLLCASMEFHEAEVGYSEVTPGACWSSRCSKGHWEMDGSVCTTTYKDNLLKAQDCRNFELSDYARKKGYRVEATTERTP